MALVHQDGLRLPLPGTSVTANEELQRLRYANALRWIYTVSSMHYMGAAFDPEHMRRLGNIAADALGGRDLPDHDEVMRNARKKARKRADRLSQMLDEADMQHAREDGEPQ